MSLDLLRLVAHLLLHGSFIDLTQTQLLSIIKTWILHLSDRLIKKLLKISLIHFRNRLFSYLLLLILVGTYL